MKNTEVNVELASIINSANAGAGLVGVSTIPHAGLGLFATRSYKANELVCIYNGEVIHHKSKRLQHSDGEYVLELSEQFVVDAKDPRKIVSPHDTGRFINGTKNRKLINCEYNCREYGEHFPIALVTTTKAIKAGESAGGSLRA